VTEYRIDDTDRATLAKGQTDPAWFVRNALGVDLWSKQLEILEAVRDCDRIAVPSCHSAGKSKVAACVVLWYLFNHRPAIVITTAPTDRQVEGILWKEIRTIHNNAPFALGGRVLTKQLKIKPNWLAFGFATSDYDPDKFQGFHEKHILVVVDEASGVTETVFEGIEGVLSSDNAKLLLISNPVRQTGEFANAIRSKSCHTIPISAFDTPNFTETGITPDDIANGNWQIKHKRQPLPRPYLVTPSWVADKHERWGPDNPLYQSRVLGQLPTEDRHSMIPLGWIRDAQARNLEPGTEAVLGVDVAREGGDETACYLRKGPVVRREFTKRQEKTTTTTGRVIVAQENTEARDVAIDSVGIGAGVYDMLLEHYGEDGPIRIHGVGFGTKPITDEGVERFANLKAQLYWYVRDKFETGDIDLDPEDEELAAQAASVRWEPDSKGRIAIVSKVKMKKLGIDSPDRFEALVYSYANEVLELGGGFYFEVA